MSDTSTSGVDLEQPEIVTGKRNLFALGRELFNGLHITNNCFYFFDSFFNSIKVMGSLL